MIRLLCVVTALLVSEAVVAFGDIAAKRWASGRVLSGDLVLALLSYVVVSGAWLVILRLHGGSLGRASIVWASTGVLTPALLGRFMFGEPVSNTGWAGFALCAIGLVLSSWK